jgi:hypothetical protein
MQKIIPAGLLLLGLTAVSAPYAQELCQISKGNESCGIAAFLWGESDKDKEGFTCGKLKGARWLAGTCEAGVLSGLVVVEVAADRRWGRSTPSQILFFANRGQPLSNYIKYSDWGISYANIKPAFSSGCVRFGGWDERARPECRQLGQQYGVAVLEQTFWASMRKRDMSPLAMLNTSSSAVNQSDDPKVRGRSARGG